jgi:hypothetical protein
MSKYWFRARKGLLSKDLGWGWIPLTWQGVVMYLILFGLILFYIFYFNLANASAGQVVGFLFAVLVTVLVFGYFADKKTTHPVIFKQKTG